MRRALVDVASQHAAAPARMRRVVTGNAKSSDGSRSPSPAPRTTAVTRPVDVADMATFRIPS